MTEQVYTLGEWHVKEGRQEGFIAAWKALGEVFGDLEEPPGRGTLVQSASDPLLFYSWGPWPSMEAVEAMREDPRAQEGIGEIVAHCTEATPGAFRVVAESP